MVEIFIKGVFKIILFNSQNKTISNTVWITMLKNNMIQLLLGYSNNCESYYIKYV